MPTKICPRYEVQLVRNGSAKYTVEKTARLSSTSAACEIVKDIVRSAMESSPCEMFAVITLDTKHVPIGFVVITQGTLDASLVHPREAFRPAIAQNAQAIILVHNHPSGDLTPSREDFAVTKRMKDAGQVVGITVLDHIVVGSDPHTGEWKSVSLEECGASSWRS